MKSNFSACDTLVVLSRSAGYHLYPKPHINMHQNKNFTNLILLTSNTKYYILEGLQQFKIAIYFNINLRGDASQLSPGLRGTGRVVLGRSSS